MKRLARHFYIYRFNPAENQFCQLSSVAARAEKLNVPSKVAQAAFEGLCKLGKGFKSNLLFRPFDVTNVISRQTGLFRQLLLAQTSLLPLVAYSFPQNAINSARR